MHEQMHSNATAEQNEEQRISIQKVRPMFVSQQDRDSSDENAKCYPDP